MPPRRKPAPEQTPAPAAARWLENPDVPPPRSQADILIDLLEREQRQEERGK